MDLDRSPFFFRIASNGTILESSGPGAARSFDADTGTDEEKVILIMEEETRRTIEDNRKHDVADTKARRTEVVISPTIYIARSIEASTTKVRRQIRHTHKDQAAQSQLDAIAAYSS
jgi:hypothetical protein